MRVALLSYNAQFHNAVGNHVAEKVRFFQERGAEVRLFVQDARRLHPDVRSCARELAEPRLDGPAWEYLMQADLLFAVYGQYYDLLQYLPRLAGQGPRIVFDYLGVTPPQFWRDQHREDLEKASQMRAYVWCADHALTISDANRRELLDATNFPCEHTTVQSLAVDVTQFHPHSSSRFLQHKIGIDGDILLYVGRLAGNKRVGILIEALARLEDATLHAVIVGDCRDVYAAEAARCVELAAKLGIERRVHFVGELSDADLAQAYCCADALVLPSLHEGFCVPVIEAMASGCPVIASRSTALPETIGDAGLTFTPDDAEDLARQIRRVIAHDDAPRPVATHRVAIVSFRFGPSIIGGAETSLRTMARTLQAAGHHVEVFTTCTTTESNWKNDVAAGTVTLDGLTVHRFLIDRTPAELRSSALIEALQAREADFDSIITGPYLFGLTADVAGAVPHKTLVVPCFHDEPKAHLPHWPNLFGSTGGILYHSAEEQDFAQTRLGVNHPNSTIIGTYMECTESAGEAPAQLRRPYVVYCGRYSEHKNVPLLIDWARRYQKLHPNRLEFVFMGQGETKLPSEPWLHDLGRVDQAVKRSVLAGAVALVQLSHNESLSLVALEAWLQKTPVIVHRECRVLAGQIERSNGGAAVTDFEEFAAALDHWLTDESTRHSFGINGCSYVTANYTSPAAYAQRIIQCIDRLRTSIAQQMCERGLERAQLFSRDRWQQRFAEFVERVLTQPPRSGVSDVRIEPLRSDARATGMRTLLLPVRYVNEGTRLAAHEGPGRTVVCYQIRSAASDAVVVPCTEMPLPAPVMPGQAHVAIVPLEVPMDEGAYSVRLWTESCEGTTSAVAEIALNVEGEGTGDASCVSVFLDAVTRTLPKAHQIQQLPADYVDVTEGALAPVKRLLKRKLLHNFKNAYVDVLSRQQSQMNEHLVLMIQQLAECCALLDQRLNAIENADFDFAATESAEAELPFRNGT